MLEPSDGLGPPDGLGNRGRRIPRRRAALVDSAAEMSEEPLHLIRYETNGECWCGHVAGASYWRTDNTTELFDKARCRECLMEALAWAKRLSDALNARLIAVESGEEDGDDTTAAARALDMYRALRRTAEPSGDPEPDDFAGVQPRGGAVFACGHRRGLHTGSGASRTSRGTVHDDGACVGTIGIEGRGRPCSCTGFRRAAPSASSGG